MGGPWPEWYDLLTRENLSRVRLSRACRRLVNAWRETGNTAAAGRRYGVSRQAVCQALRVARQVIERQQVSANRPGRPRIASTENVRAVVRALIGEGAHALSVSQFVAEFMARLRCSRRTAFRALAEGKQVGLPWGSDTNGKGDSDTETFVV